MKLSAHRNGAGFALQKEIRLAQAEGRPPRVRGRKGNAAKTLNRIERENEKYARALFKLKPSDRYLGVRIRKPRNKFYPVRLKQLIKWWSHNDELFGFLCPKPLLPKLAMLYQMFLKKSFKFCPNEIYFFKMSVVLYLHVFGKDIIKHHKSRVTDNLIETKSKLLHFRSTHSEMKWMVKTLGYAALPQAVVETPQGEKKVHAVRLFDILPAMIQFAKRNENRLLMYYSREVDIISANLPNEPLLRSTVFIDSMVVQAERSERPTAPPPLQGVKKYVPKQNRHGKGYSSDVTGDGPEPRRDIEINLTDKQKALYFFIFHIARNEPLISEILLLWISDMYNFRTYEDLITYSTCHCYWFDPDYDDPEDYTSLLRYYTQYEVKPTLPNYLRISEVFARIENRNIVVFPQLNGANGEWTGTDDLEFILRALWLNTIFRTFLYSVRNFDILIYLFVCFWVRFTSIIYSLKGFYYLLLWFSHVNHIVYVLTSTLYGYLTLAFIFVLASYYNHYGGIFYLNPFARNAQNFARPNPPTVEERNYGQPFSAVFNFMQIPIPTFMRRRVYGGLGKKTMNRGNGGKSKLKAGPKVDPKKVAEAREASEKLDSPGEEKLENPIEVDDKSVYNDYLCSDFPKQRCRFTSNEVLVARPQAYIFDCHGAPFCGLTCVDIAVGLKPDIEQYKKMAKAVENVFELGSTDYIASYAHSRGVNLQIRIPVFPIVPGGQVVEQNYQGSLEWDWIILDWKAPFGWDPVNNNDVVGHYRLVVTQNHSSKLSANDDPLVFLNTDLNQQNSFLVANFIFTGLLFRYTVTEVQYDHDKVDRRETTHKRDPSEVQDCHLFMSWRYVFYFWSPAYFSIDFDPAFIHIMLNNAQDFLERFDIYLWFFTNNLPPHLQFHFIFDGDQRSVLTKPFGWILSALIYFSDPLSNLIATHFAEYMPRGHVVISFQKFKRVILEAQVAKPEDRELCLALLSQTRYINTNVNLHNILYNTRKFCELYIRMMPRFGAHVRLERVAVNPLGQQAMINNLGVVQDNQLRARAVMGAGKINDRYNMVKRFKPKKNVVNRVVGVSPSITFTSSGKQLGPGPICVTDDYSLLAAFAGRSMSKDPDTVQHDELDKLEAFADKFSDKIVQSIDFSGVSQQDPRDAIKRLYAGKKPTAMIDGLVKGYTSYLEGKHGTKYTTPSCFTKLENSAKRKGLNIKVKPRLIMVMSELMLMEYAQVLDVIDKWNSSTFKKYQIKHQSEQEIIEKVLKVTSFRHIVTDYSSFECSIIGRIRKLENQCIKKCLKRAGLTIALRRFEADFEGSRVLKNLGCQFHITSRNSGDFHTSWMNGYINVLLGAYSYHINHPEDPELVNFSMLAEGDDGLRPPNNNDSDIAAWFGFSFSQAVTGNQPGDVDFLRVRWIDGHKLLNIARCLKLAWVITGRKLSLKNSLAIQRCSALSMHYTSPGHPILWALAKRIGIETRPGALSKRKQVFFNKFSNTESLDEAFIGVSKRFPDMQVDQKLRRYVAAGAEGFPPIPIPVQIAIEKRILDLTTREINLCGLLDEYEETLIYRDYDFRIQLMPDLRPSEDMQELLELFPKYSPPKIFDFTSDSLKYKEKFDF